MLELQTRWVTVDFEMQVAGQPAKLGLCQPWPGAAPQVALSVGSFRDATEYSGIPFGKQGTCPVAEPDQHGLNRRRWIEVVAMQSVHDLNVPPGLKAQRPQRLVNIGHTDKSLGGLALQDEPRVLRWVRCTVQSANDIGRSCVRWIPKQFVGDARQRRVQEVPMDDLSFPIEQITKVGHEERIQFYRYDLARALGEG